MRWCRLVLVAALFLVACGGEPDVVRYGGQYYPEEWLLKGLPELWGEQKVEHVLFSSGTENNQALLAGTVDINVGSDSKTAALFAARDDILILATVQRGDRYSTMVRTDSPYRDWADLKGKTVATRLGTGAEQVLLRYFDSRDDLSWDDFEWVNLKVENMVFALESGQVEAFTAWEPTPAIAEATGVGKVLRSYGDVASVPVSLHTTVGYAEKHQEQIVRFLMGHVRKVKMIEETPWYASVEAGVAASKQGVEVPSLAFFVCFQRIDFSMEFDEDVLLSLQDTAEFLYEKGKIDKVPEFRWDSSYLEEAVRRVERE